MAGLLGLEWGAAERTPGVLGPGIARELPGHGAWSPGPAHLDWRGRWLPLRLGCPRLKLDLPPMALGSPQGLGALLTSGPQTSSGREKGVRRCWSLLSRSSSPWGLAHPGSGSISQSDEDSSACRSSKRILCCWDPPHKPLRVLFFWGGVS